MGHIFNRLRPINLIHPNTVDYEKKRVGLLLLYGLGNPLLQTKEVLPHSMQQKKFKTLGLETMLSPQCLNLSKGLYRPFWCFLCVGQSPNGWCVGFFFYFFFLVCSSCSSAVNTLLSNAVALKQELSPSFFEKILLKDFVVTSGSTLLFVCV
jgi:hypothetical protein